MSSGGDTHGGNSTFSPEELVFIKGCIFSNTNILIYKHSHTSMSKHTNAYTHKHTHILTPIHREDTQLLILLGK